MTSIRSFLLVVLLAALGGCSSPFAADPTPTTLPATAAPSSTPLPTPTPTLTPTPTPLGCLSQPGKVESGSLASSKPPQDFLIYLPSCYEHFTDQRYPVLYLLHGQTYTDQQWLDMGAAKVADHLIHSNQVAPFIMVFPDDRYWNLPAGPGFGDRLLTMVVPYVDAHYRTLADAPHRAVGGLSRGGGWAIHMALTEYSVFGIVGLHSPVIFDDDSAVLEKLFAAVPSKSWPHIWIDGGDRDGELGNIQRFEGLLTTDEVPHEWRLYSGDHSENYWSAHLPEYLRWYAQQFGTADGATATP
ncbi:MAG TPA: alpha/beta hydrolase-fold protein [Anaerolineales bacterium]|nr:alpha/beta hydrolase-fold protein [Anaerolineales bacterium]